MYKDPQYKTTQHKGLICDIQQYLTVSITTHLLYSDCQYAIIILFTVMPNVIMLNVIMLNVIILNVVMLSVTAPSLWVDCHHGGDAVYCLFGDCRQLPVAIFPADGVVHLKTGERVLGRFRIKSSSKKCHELDRQ